MQWEYLVTELDDKERTSEMQTAFLQEHGKQRWELVAVKDWGVFYFKRRHFQFFDSSIEIEMDEGGLPECEWCPEGQGCNFQ